MYTLGGIEANQTRSSESGLLNCRRSAGLTELLIGLYELDATLRAKGLSTGAVMTFSMAKYTALTLVTWIAQKTNQRCQSGLRLLP